MKVRSDFVSNSSSSSFILAKCAIIEYFNITKQDIIDALTNLMGEKYIQDYIKESKELAKKYGDDKNDTKYQESGPFYVYDLTDKNDRKSAIKYWGSVLDDWDCNVISRNKETGNYVRNYPLKEYKMVCNAISNIYNLSALDGVIKNQKDIDELEMFVRTEEQQEDGRYGYDKKVSDTIGKFLFDLRKQCGIITNKEVLELQLSKFFIHFDDNEIMNVKDFISPPSKYSHLYSNPKDDYEKKFNEDVKNSKYISDDSTSPRFLEILWNYWIDNGKIKCNDREFLEREYPLSEYQNMKKSVHTKDSDNLKYSTRNEKDLSFMDLHDELLTFCMHEG